MVILHKQLKVFLKTTVWNIDCNFSLCLNINALIRRSLKKRRFLLNNTIMYLLKELYKAFLISATTASTNTISPPFLNWLSDFSPPLCKKNLLTPAEVLTKMPHFINARICIPGWQVLIGMIFFSLLRIISLEVNLTRT